MLADGQTGLLCGGWCNDTAQSACYYYSSINNTWTSAPSLTVARAWHGMAVYGGIVYVYGGQNSGHMVHELSSVEMLNGSTWDVLPFEM